MITKEDLYAIDAFNEERVRAIFEAAYTKVFQEVAGAGLIPANLIIDAITDELHPVLHLMVTDASSELDW